MSHRLLPLSLSLLVVLAFACVCGAARAREPELVEIDAAGVIRWRADGREVALFGANYCLPSASDYRAAGKIGADRRALIEQDFAHFARLGWDGVRLSFWGDWENSDRAGNLVANDHLDLLDRCIASARRHGLYILFSPITNHSSWWPDSTAAAAPNGFSKFFEKSKLGTDPTAIAAQANYLRQILEHVNPHTGVALKDEPAILFVELINEPWHHSDDTAGSVAYINTLVDAVRATGCEKLVFHNVSQDFGITPAIRASRAQGVTVGWYPTGLINRRTLVGNHLPSVDDYAPMRRDDLRPLPKLVYEFDSADQAEATMYPAMVRTFRSVGAQFAAAFSYDMLATAPYNLGWQTHLISLVHAPRKAVASVIAAEAMRRLPRGEDYGRYPRNTRFGPFRISHADNLAELVLPEVFMHAGDTTTAPPAPDKLERVVGFGSSPVVHYEGLGAYFLDQLSPGVWRLEVYPDAVLVQDPFAQRQNSKTVSSRLLARAWPMTVRLPDLGDRFHLRRLGASAADDETRSTAVVATASTAASAAATSASGAITAVPAGGTFTVRPGVYLLHATSPFDLASASLPATVASRVLLRAFICPEPPTLPPQAVHQPQVFHAPEAPVRLTFALLGDDSFEDVTLHIRGETEPEERRLPLPRIRAYDHAATLPAGVLPAGAFAYHITVRHAGAEVRFPATGTWASRVFPANATLMLLHGGSVPLDELHITDADFPKARALARAAAEPKQTAAPATLRINAPGTPGPHRDFSVSRSIATLTQARGAALRDVRALRLRYRAAQAGWRLSLSLVESDGTTWSALLPDAADWTERELAFDQFVVGRGAQLPTGYPGNWNYWREPAEGRGGAGDRVRLEAVEHVQLSFRLASDTSPNLKAAPATTATLAGAHLDLDFVAVGTP